MGRNGGGNQTLISPALPLDVQRVLRSFEAQINTLKTQISELTTGMKGKLGASPEDLLHLSGYVRDQLQAAGSNPLSLSSLLGVAGQPQRALVPQTTTLPTPGTAGAVIFQNGQLYRSDGTTWTAIGTTTILDTHANRLLVAYAATKYAAGTLFNETDRNVLYVVRVVSGANAWVYLAGTHSAVFTSRPTDLGANDAGFLFFATDRSLLYEWSGAAWNSSPALPLTIANGGTGQITQQAALNALTGTQVSGRYVRSDGANASLAAIQAADVPTLNQNTTGTAANVTGTVAVANGGTGQTSAAAALTALGGASLTAAQTFSGIETFSMRVNFSQPQNLFFGSNFVGYTPTISASGSMTVTGVNMNDAEYLVIGPLLFVRVYVTYTLGGVASNTVYVTTPQNNVISVEGISCHVLHGGANWQPATSWIEANEARVKVMLPGIPNFALGVGGVLLSGFYRIS